MASVKNFWTRFKQKGGFLLQKGKRYFSIVTLPFKLLKEKYQRWPRILQIGSLYLLVVILSGAVYLWRSAQLRTITPYIDDKFNFTELEDEELPENKDETVDQEPPGEPATEEPEADEPPPVKETEEPLPQTAWPLQGRKLLCGFGDYLEEDHPYYWGHISKWIEIESEPGEEVRSILNGTVEEIIERNYPGRALKIKHEHDKDLVAYYAALDEISVVEGQTVKSGEFIATVRQGDEVNPAYLYLEMWQDGKRIDPLKVLP